MKKRILCLGVSILFVLAIFPFFYVSADESALAVYTLNYQISYDNGSSWSNRLVTLNYGESITFGTNQTVRFTGLTITKQSNNYDDLYFIIRSGIFYSGNDINNNNNVVIKKISDGIIGFLSADTNSYQYNFQSTFGPYTSGTYTFQFYVYDSISYDSFLDNIVSWLSQIGDNLDSFYADWSASFLPHFDNIWQILTQTNYTYLSFAGHGAGLNSAVVKNPMLAINGQLSALVRYFNKIQSNSYSYQSISFNNGIGSVTQVSNVPWFDAVLGQLQGDSAIEQHHMELENEVLEQGIDDQYSAYLGALPYGIGLIGYGQNFFEYSDLYEKDGIDNSASSSYQNWYSAYNKFSIDSVQAKNEVIVDFYSQNHIDFGGGLN